MKKLLVILIFSAFPVHAEDMYFVGHSLIGNLSPKILKGHASLNGRSIVYDQQNIPGASVDWSWGVCDPASDNYKPGKKCFYNDANKGWDRFFIIESQPVTPYWINKEPWKIPIRKFYDLHQQHSPGSKFYYIESWPCIHTGADLSKCRRSGKYAGSVPGVFWLERIESELGYHENVVNYINTFGNAELIPTGQAWLELDSRLNEVPGYNNINQFFQDNIHPTDQGRYFVAMVYYSSIYDESPVLNNNSAAAAYGLTKQQAKALQQIAWDAVSKYKASIM